MKNAHLELVPDQDPLQKTPADLAQRIVDSFSATLDIEKGQIDVFTIDPNDYVLGNDVYTGSEREVAGQAFEAMHAMLSGSKKLSIEQPIEPMTGPARETRTYWSFPNQQNPEKAFYVTEYDNAFGTRGRLPFSAVITAKKPDEMRYLEELKYAHLTNISRLPRR